MHSSFHVTTMLESIQKQREYFLGTSYLHYDIKLLVYIYKHNNLRQQKHKRSFI